MVFKIKMMHTTKLGKKYLQMLIVIMFDDQLCVFFFLSSIFLFKKLPCMNMCYFITEEP